MATYRLNTGMWETRLRNFSSDKRAWEELRKHLPHKWARLEKEVKTGLIMNPKKNQERYERKYTSQKIDDARRCWVVVTFGTTDQKWGFDYDNIPLI